MRCLALVALGIAVLASLPASALAARPATHAEIVALQHSARTSLLFGAEAASVTVTRACISTVERGFAAVILQTPGSASTREITLFRRNPNLRPAWHLYGFASPQNLWFGKNPTSPYASRLRAEHDLKANCGLPAWATRM